MNILQRLLVVAPICAAAVFLTSHFALGQAVGNGGGVQAQATACGATVTAVGNTVYVPACATPLATGNGGTGTSAPAPQALPTACGGSVAYTGSWPSQTLRVPNCASFSASTGNPQAITNTSTSYVAIGTCGTNAANCSSGTLSFTTGPTGGPNNEWLVTVYGYFTGATAAAQYVSGCAGSSSTFTPMDYSEYEGGAICNGSYIGRFAGTATFGSTNGSHGGQFGVLSASLLVANSTTFSMTCATNSQASTSATIYAYCRMKAVPY